jgi:hypothetical protein
MKLLIPAALVLSLAACSSMHSSSYMVTVRDASDGTAIEGALVEVRAAAAESAEPRARSTTDGRGESVVIVPGWNRADLFITFDGETERYFFSPELAPRYDAPKEDVEGKPTAVRFIAGPEGTPAWRVRVVRVIDRVY